MGTTVRGPDGSRLGHCGVYRVIVPPDRLVYTELLEDQSYPGRTLVTHEVVEQDGTTSLTSTLLMRRGRVATGC